jgi:peptidoglycan/LPS O-acetylase OafA/YrhL
MLRSKINTFFSTLNFVLVFVGYQLATSLFLPVSSDMEGISRTVTVPYRAFALLISLLVILLNLKKRVGKTPLALKVLWVYWFALIICIFYDTNIRIDVTL